MPGKRRGELTCFSRYFGSLGEKRTVRLTGNGVTCNIPIGVYVEER